MQKCFGHQFYKKIHCRKKISKVKLLCATYLMKYGNNQTIIISHVFSMNSNIFKTHYSVISNEFS